CDQTAPRRLATAERAGRRQPARPRRHPRRSADARPGDFVTTTVTEAKPYFLLADSGYTVRPSSAGDAYDRAQADSCGAPTPGQGAGARTNLGMPTIRTRG